MISSFVSSTGRATGAARAVGAIAVSLAFLAISGVAQAHGVAESDQEFIEGTSGINLIPYMYLGAKHMVTGYDHLLFLAGVVFFLYRMKDVGIYVTLFAIGHSTTLLVGTIFDIRANAYIVDAIIGLSVAYKAFDNLDGFTTVFGWRPDPKKAVLVFGLFHGFGLATKLQDLTLSQEGLVPNLLAFNVGVELGQFMALAVILIAMNFWRLSPSFQRTALTANAALMSAGFILVGYQLTGYFTQGA
ncbi:HupE/UreJ family protein [Croceicoccus ponticola]|uniref:HupE/UreJ family protein n=1 Tax=Croceicoccus ponticola TaxID=2217664 RepID=A0A437H0L7_9SPHN|nr:HupE/UreJ family protein [Croceicoccus ponticola]RVQ69148.1 HupE/UreJ family protein [Croceicoccus ponticola]